MHSNLISNGTKLTPDQSDTIQRLLSGINHSSYDQGALYKRLICDSSEAIMNVLLRIAQDMFRDGYDSVDHSMQVDQHKIYAIKPNDYSVVLAAEHLEGAQNIAFFMELNGKSNPKIDRIIRHMFEEARQKHEMNNGDEPKSEDINLADQEFLKGLTDKTLVKKITAFKYYLPNRAETILPNAPLDFARALEKVSQSESQYQPTLERSIDTILEDKYLLDKILRVSKSLGFLGENWMRGSGEDWGDHWQQAFGIIRALLEQAPQEIKDMYARDALAFSERQYQSFTSNDSRAAIEQVADNLNQFSGYLLGTRAVEGLEMAEKVFKESSIKSCLQNLVEIYDFCTANNHTDYEHRFLHNDLDNDVYAVGSDIEKLHLLVFSDQNRKFVCSMQMDGHKAVGLRVHVFADSLETAFEEWVAEGGGKEELLWVNNEQMANPFSTPRFYDLKQALCDAEALESYLSPTLLAAFQIDGERISMMNEPSLDLEMIKCWNSFIPDIGCAHCALEEEYPGLKSKV